MSSMLRVKRVGKMMLIDVLDLSSFVWCVSLMSMMVSMLSVLVLISMGSGFFELLMMNVMMMLGSIV